MNQEHNIASKCHLTDAQATFVFLGTSIFSIAVAIAPSTQLTKNFEGCSKLVWFAVMVSPWWYGLATMTTGMDCSEEYELVSNATLAGE